MAAVDFKSIEQEIAALAGNVFPKYVGQATQDAKTFVQNSQAKYLEYVAQLADPGPDGIDEDDFEANMLDLQALAEMDLLKQEGLAQVAIDQFTSGVVNILIQAGLSAVKL
jgi:hypothetical protein